MAEALGRQPEEFTDIFNRFPPTSGRNGITQVFVVVNISFWVHYLVRFLVVHSLHVCIGSLICSAVVSIRQKIEPKKIY